LVIFYSIFAIVDRPSEMAGTNESADVFEVDERERINN
jgi:hypothetical protein